LDKAAAYVGGIVNTSGDVPHKRKLEFLFSELQDKCISILSEFFVAFLVRLPIHPETVILKEIKYLK